MARYRRKFFRYGGRRYGKSAVGSAVSQIIVGLVLLWVMSKIVDVVVNAGGINTTNFGAITTWLTPVLPILALLVVILPIVRLVRGKLF